MRNCFAPPRPAAAAPAETGLVRVRSIWCFASEVPRFSPNWVRDKSGLARDSGRLPLPIWREQQRFQHGIAVTTSLLQLNWKRTECPEQSQCNGEHADGQYSAPFQAEASCKVCRKIRPFTFSDGSRGKVAIEPEHGIKPSIRSRQ